MAFKACTLMDKEQEKRNSQEKKEKYFNEAEYHTAIVLPDGSVKPLSKRQEDIDELIALLSSGNHEHKDAALEILKEVNDINLLKEAIIQTENRTLKATLIAACWESGLDIKGNEDFFAGLALDPDTFVSLEAFTVLDSAENMEIQAMQEILQLMPDSSVEKHINKDMLLDLKSSLTEKIKQAG